MASSIPLRVLVCDDELMARKRVLRLLGELGGVEAAIECESGEQVLARLREDDVDIAILDVNMPGMSGIETVLAMPEERPYIVFVTAHPEHAVKAFEVGAVDYVLKPVDDARLSKAIERARAFLDHGPSGRVEGGDAGAGVNASANLNVRKLTKLAIATHDGAALVAPSDVTHATFDGNARLGAHVKPNDSHRRHPPGPRDQARPSRVFRAGPPACDPEPRPCRAPRIGGFRRLCGLPLDRQARRRISSECAKATETAWIAVGYDSEKVMGERANADDEPELVDDDDEGRVDGGDGIADVRSRLVGDAAPDLGSTSSAADHAAG